MTCPATTSRGWPCRSYMASRKNGSMTIIMQNAAALLLAVRLSKKKSGTPMSAAAPKHISCRLVSPNSTLDFTFVKSLEWLHTPIYQASLMRSEQALREAAGLEQGEAQQDRVAHAGPYRA